MEQRDCLMHGQCTAFEVDVAPAKAKNLASSKAGCKREQPQLPVRIVFGFAEKLARLLGGP